ncbi:MAG: hypothetical protein NTW86_22020 [Candidatus Sumerlaeota bacterium]|nr:hypothetical protein [Candidatus Sumerlaeota bacterium]
MITRHYSTNSFPTWRARRGWSRSRPRARPAAARRFQPARSIPIDLLRCPTPQKPRRNAPDEDWKRYRHEQSLSRLSRQGVRRVRALRQALDQEPGGKNHPLIIDGDGGYTNETVLKNLPARTTFTGRIRKDAKLYAAPPAPGPGQPGRKPSSGPRLPTPDQIRLDPAYPRIKARAWAADRWHDFRLKTLAPVRWRTAGAHLDLRRLVIAPLAYRLSRRSRLLSREPAYLICTDPTLAVELFLQSYRWRGGIENNFRQEKTVVRAGQAQVRLSPPSPPSSSPPMPRSSSPPAKPSDPPTSAPIPCPRPNGGAPPEPPSLRPGPHPPPARPVGGPSPGPRRFLRLRETTPPRHEP